MALSGADDGQVLLDAHWTQGIGRPRRHYVLILSFLRLQPSRGVDTETHARRLRLVTDLTRSRS
jgi:hypothetical protein